MTVMSFRYNPTDSRLGRHVRHDTRSVFYAHGVMPRSAIRSAEWQRHIPILDQGPLGSCVPNNGPEFLGTDALGYTGGAVASILKADTKGVFQAGTIWSLDEDFARNLYRLVTRLDSYPGQWEPDDTGSDGLTLAKALRMLGFADRYTHAFSYHALVSALQTGPVTLGLEWENSMFTTGTDGKITIDYGSGVAGGHQVFARKFDADNDRVWIDNSWGESFGLDGRGWFQGVELAAHLKRSGDVTVPHLITEEPAPAAVGDRDLWAYAKAWAAGKGMS